MLDKFLVTLNSAYCLMTHRWCRRRRLDQTFALSGCERSFLQDDDHSGSRPHSFPGLLHMHSGKSRERIPSDPEIVGSEETRQSRIRRLKCGFPSYWTPWTVLLLLHLRFSRRLEWYNPLVIWEHLCPLPGCCWDVSHDSPCWWLLFFAYSSELPFSAGK